MSASREARQKIIARIRALQSKTVENGCTENEALAAAEMASRLMEEYEVDFSEEDVAAEDVTAVDVETGLGRRGHRRQHDVKWVAVAVSRFCQVRAITSRTDDGRLAIRFMGLREDVTWAEWLMAMLRGAMERAWRDYRRDNVLWTHPATARANFMYSMTLRINERLDEITNARKRAAVTEGRALVVVKDAAVARWLVARGLKASLGAGSVKGHSRMRDDSAASAAGREAGNNVGFGRPVSGGAAVRRIANA